MKKVEEIFKSRGGNLSSKRVAGMIVIAVAIIMGIVLFGFSVDRSIGDSKTAMSVIEWFLLAGGGLLGVGVFEKIKR